MGYGEDPPEAPAGFDPASLNTFTAEWHQKWEVFKGVWTPGCNPIAKLAVNAQLPERMDGLRILDIGAFNGCLSFECERRGAAEVVAFDLTDEHQYGFQPMKELLGSQVRYVQGTSYRLDRDALGMFDIVLFFGVLYHLRYPLLALDQIRKICAGVLYVETLVIDDRVVLPGENDVTLDAFHPRLRRIPLWQFYPGSELAGDASNWFGPNIRAVLAGLTTAGFDARITSSWGDRATFRAVPSQTGVAEAMGDSYESRSSMSRKLLHLD